MAAVSFSTSTPKALETVVTVSLSTHAANSTYNAVLTNHSGHTTTYPVTTDGSGAASFKFVPQGPGSYSVSTYLVTSPTATATGSVSAGGAT